MNKNNKSIETLIEDIYNLFTKGAHISSEDNLEVLAQGMKDVIRKSLLESGQDREKSLRFSNMGKSNRQVWFDLKDTDTTSGFSATNYINFLFGHILEELLMFLVKEAGHKVSLQQEEVEHKGVMGHTDGAIDDVVVDVKSASSYSFQKFAKGEILRDKAKDPFGYVGQLSGYHSQLIKEHPELDKNKTGWLVIDKQYGTLCLLTMDDMDMINAEKKIEELQIALEKDTPPEEKCFDPVPLGKTGNMQLHVNCGWCKHKHKCWADVNKGKGLRGFHYSKGTTWLTHVEKEPKVPEVGDSSQLDFKDET